MADDSGVPEVQLSPQVDSQGRGPQHYVPSPRPQFPKPPHRTPRQIADVASVLGSPPDEITPGVHEAHTLLFNEYDSVRWDLQVSEGRTAHLQDQLDRHDYLPVLNRRALLRQIKRTAAHVQETGASSTLVYFRLTGAEEMKGCHGLAAYQTAMAAMADTISAHLRQEDLLGVFDGADVVVIFSMADPKMAAAISDAIEKAIGRYPADAAGGGFPTGAAWRAHPITADITPEAIVAAAETALRSDRPSEPAALRGIDLLRR